MAAMVEKNSPEHRAFQKNYVILLNLRSGIHSISDKAFAAGLISKDLRNKCSNGNLTDKEQTSCLLDALADKMLYVPNTLQDFVDILNGTSSFEYIGKRLKTSLDEERGERQLQAELQQCPSRAPSGKTISFRTLEEAKKELVSLAQELKTQVCSMLLNRRCTCSVPRANTLPGHSNQCEVKSKRER